MKEASSLIGRVLSMLRNRDFWLIVAMLAISALFHYGSHIRLIALISGQLPLGLTRHTMERILFLLPITYAGFIFGPLIGFMTLVMAALLMLPRAIFFSPDPKGTLLETGAILLTGGLIILWFESLEKEKARRAEAIAKLEVAQQELQAHVQVIERDKKQLSALNALSSALSQSLELESVLNSALERVLTTMKLEAEGGIFLLNEKARELALTVHKGLTPEFVCQEERVALGECLCGYVAQSGELLFSDDSHRDIRHTRQPKAGAHSHIIVPLKSKEQVLGVMFLYPHTSYAPTTEDLRLLSNIGNQIGIAIKNADLYKKAHVVAEQLRVSEKNYRELFETASDAIWVQDVQGKIVTVNEAATRLTGYPLRELTTMNVQELLLPDGLETARRVRQKLLKGEVMEPHEQQLLKKDGTLTIMKLATSVITRDGEVVSYQHIARDITEEKKMQDNLRFYVQQITKAQEEERKRIAGQLHDETIQELVALLRQLDTFSNVREQLPQHAIRLLDELQNRTDGMIRSIRRFSQDLRPSVLDDLGLAAALQSVADDVTERFGIATEVKVTGEQQRVSPEKELLLFRIAQEAVGNAWRHSHASAISIVLEFTQDKVKITVQDNGIGFRVPARLGDLASTGKLGLAGMYERTQLLGGSLTVQSELGKGTTVAIEVCM